jgi:predicted nucleic acid-binding protein
MKYLLDVNALLAFGLVQHELHERVAVWLKAQEPPEVATCSITELGFVRILAQAGAYDMTVAQARSVLLHLKSGNAPTFRFIADDNDISHLPIWVKTPKQTTDGHLAQLAIRNGGLLATLDEGIPGSFLIPYVG